MGRLAFYVDGFNNYHAIDRNCPDLLWLNYNSLAKQFLEKRERLVRVVFFSAYAKWKPDAWKRHQKYVTALESAGVKVVLGEFKKIYRECYHCNRQYLSHEEKRTDVNIALHVVQDAILGKYDRAIVASADGDLAPIWVSLKRLAIPKKVGILLPIGIQHSTLERFCDFVLHLREGRLRKAQFPDSLSVPGRDPIVKPFAWIDERIREFQRRRKLAEQKRRLKGGLDP